MIQEAYCSFEVAKLLKEKIFIEPCLYYYFSDGIIGKSKGLKHRNCSSVNTFSMPTHQMAMAWLREVYNLYIEIFVTWKNKIPHYQWRIDNLITQDTIVDTPCLEKPEEAVEAALKYCLENLIFK